MMGSWCNQFITLFCLQMVQCFYFSPDALLCMDALHFLQFGVQASPSMYIIEQVCSDNCDHLCQNTKDLVWYFPWQLIHPRSIMHNLRSSVLPGVAHKHHFPLYNHIFLTNEWAPGSKPPPVWNGCNKKALNWGLCAVDYRNINMGDSHVPQKVPKRAGFKHLQNLHRHAQWCWGEV